MSKQQNWKLAAILILAAALELSGCSVEPVPVMEKQISMTEQGTAASTGSSIGDKGLLSEDICVVPESRNIATDPAITAASALLINASKKKVIYAQDIYSRQFPASVSKIATALMALKYADLSDTVTVSHNASHITEQGAKLCGLSEGDQISMKNLLYCMLVYSGNDASVAIAEHISGSEEAFAEKMNQEMTGIGASGTHFVNASGLHDEEHYTTAYDLYLIFHQCLKYKKFVKIIGEKKRTVTWRSAEGKERRLDITATDSFMTGSAPVPEGLTVLGLKNGTSVKAGSCLILYAQDSHKQRYISVMLHAASSDAMTSQMSQLLEKIH